MTNFFNIVLNSPIYIILFGSGGILTIIISVLAIVIQRKKKYGRCITVRSSQNTKIENNKLDTKEIQVSKSRDIVIKNNEIKG